MTYDDDHAVMHLENGRFTFWLKDIGLSWPPPERIRIGIHGAREATPDDPEGTVLVMARRSEITDAQRAEMTNVCRGAEYFYERV